ncbi:hypothetical protein [Nocardiopsis sp. NPDC058789]|uniref:hypothetical protein n=1 Tax=Nocardiopsis sp. NPDC058789 TaxID=3346634 RepID=UPI00366CEE12
MNPLYFEIVAWAVTLAGAGVVIYGALGTARSWASHPLALIEPLRQALANLARAWREEPEGRKPVGLTVSPAQFTLRMEANGHARLNPIEPVDSLEALTRETNIRFDHIYDQNAAYSKAIFDQKTKIREGKSELDKQIELRFKEASGQIDSIEGRVAKEFISAARLQMLGASAVVLGLAFQVMAKLIA